MENHEMRGNNVTKSNQKKLPRGHSIDVNNKLGNYGHAYLC